MTTSVELGAQGQVQAVCDMLGQDLATALVATGSSKSDALQLKVEVNKFATVASATGCILQNASGSPPVVIYNGGAHALSVYAKGTNTINALVASAAFSLASGKAAIFVASGTTWIGFQGV